MWTKEQKAKYNKNYYYKNRKQFSLYQKEYYQKNREQILLYQKDYRQKHYNTLQGYLRSIFSHIKQRCNNPKDPGYKNYGGRGIKCLFENFDDFANYVINELKVNPKGLAIDRINNDGNYEKGNIRFVTQKENNKNKGEYK